MRRGSWFVDQRVNWIIESVRIFGAIKRRHVQAKFGVSAPQAANDFAEVLRRHPGVMSYDASAKAYRPEAP